MAEMLKGMGISRDQQGKIVKYGLWIAYGATIVVLALLLTRLMQVGAIRRSEGWESMGGGLYRRVDCQARTAIYKDSGGGLGQPPMNAVIMPDDVYQSLCVEKGYND